MIAGQPFFTPGTDVALIAAGVALGAAVLSYLGSIRVANKTVQAQEREAARAATLQRHLAADDRLFSLRVVRYGKLLNACEPIIQQVNATFSQPPDLLTVKALIEAMHPHADSIQAERNDLNVVAGRRVTRALGGYLEGLSGMIAVISNIVDYFLLRLTRAQDAGLSVDADKLALLANQAYRHYGSEISDARDLLGVAYIRLAGAMRDDLHGVPPDEDPS